MHFVHLVAPKLLEFSPSHFQMPTFSTHIVFYVDVFRDITDFPPLPPDIPVEEALSRCFASPYPWGLKQHLEIFQNEVIEMHFLKLKKRTESSVLTQNHIFLYLFVLASTNLK